MYIETAIAISKEDPGDNILAAVSWYRFIEPPFPKRGLTLPYMKENMLSVVVLRGENVEKLFKTACSRTLEKLAVKKIHNPNLILLTRSNLKKIPVLFEREYPKKHWLLTAADRALQDWFRGNK